MRTIFLTGISGTLGSKIAEMAVERGDRVIGLVRSIINYKGVLHPLISLVEGSLFSELSHHFRGVDLVIHAAAETSQSKTRYVEYKKINLDATVQLFQLAVKCKVPKFIFVSTANTWNKENLTCIRREPDKIEDRFKDSFYVRSKYEAEKYLFENSHLMQILVVNPTFLIGSSGPLRSSNRILTRALRKPFIFYPPGGKNFILVEDVVKFILSHQTNQVGYEKRLLIGQNMSYQDFYKKFIRIAEQKSLLIRIPKYILLFLGYFGDMIRILKIPTSLSSVNSKIICAYDYYSPKLGGIKIPENYLDFSIQSIVEKQKKVKA
jgi:dihydroflavonol-4-reductase